MQATNLMRDRSSMIVWCDREFAAHIFLKWNRAGKGISTGKARQEQVPFWRTGEIRHLNSRQIERLRHRCCTRPPPVLAVLKAGPSDSVKVLMRPAAGGR